MNKEIKVLGDGYVKYIDHMGSDESIIDNARMSTEGSFVSWEPYAGHPKGDAGLLSFLYRNQHMTPFESGELMIEVQAPIFVVREWFRHRTMSYNEASARYSVMPDLHYLPSWDRLVKQDQKNKQGSSDTELAHEAKKDALLYLKTEQDAIYIHYKWMLDFGLAREVARINTPVSRYTKFRAKANLRNWLQFLALRLPENAQMEIRVFAEAVASIVKELWPRTWALFEEHTLYGMHLSRTEAEEYRQWKAQQKLPDGWRWTQAERIDPSTSVLVDRTAKGAWDIYINGEPAGASQPLHDAIAAAECFLEGGK